MDNGSSDTEIPRGEPEGLLSDDPKGPVLSRVHVLFLSWITAAGLYGFFVAEYGSAAVDPTSTTAYPPNAWMFVLFGASLATGMYATLLRARESDSDE